MLPCEHCKKFFNLYLVVCWSCLVVYLRQSKNCFYCKAEIKETTKLDILEKKNETI